MEDLLVLPKLAENLQNGASISLQRRHKYIYIKLGRGQSGSKKNESKVKMERSWTEDWPGGILLKARGFTIVQIGRKTSVFIVALQSDKGFLCNLHGSRYRRGKRHNVLIVSIKKAADGGWRRRRKIVYEKKEYNKTKSGLLRNTFLDSKEQFL